MANWITDSEIAFTAKLVKEEGGRFIRVLEVEFKTIEWWHNNDSKTTIEPSKDDPRIDWDFQFAGTLKWQKWNWTHLVAYLQSLETLGPIPKYDLFVTRPLFHWMFGRAIKCRYRRRFPFSASLGFSMLDWVFRRLKEKTDEKGAISENQRAGVQD